MHRTVGSNLNRLHADALFGHALDQTLTMLAVEGLLIVEDLIGALATRGNRRIGTAVLFNPCLDNRNLLSDFAIGHFVVLSALRRLFTVLAFNLYNLGLLLLDLGERRRRGDNLEQLPAQYAGQGKCRDLAVDGRLRPLGRVISRGRLSLCTGLTLGICPGIAFLLGRGRALLRTLGLIPLRLLALELLHRGLDLLISVLCRCLLGHGLGI